MNDIIDVLINRDGFTREEAINEIKFAKEEIMNAILNGQDPEDILIEQLGLEPDYLSDLLGL